MSSDARDFNNMETRAVIKVFFFLQGKEPKAFHAIVTETSGKHAASYAIVKNWVARLNVVIFPPVIRLVLDDPNTEHPEDY